MKSVISLVLILFLFVSPSPHNQNTEEPQQEDDSAAAGAGAQVSAEDMTVPPIVDAASCEVEPNIDDHILLSTSTPTGIESIVGSFTEDTASIISEGTEDFQEPEDLSSIPGSDSQAESSFEETVIEMVRTEERKLEVTPPAPPEMMKSEDSIPSFSEWTKQELAQRKESIINNVQNKSSVIDGKNFASPNCGAKVINANSEAHNPSGVISSNQDEYMLNKCTTNTWFIIELCEPLTLERLTLGNLELFSSNPHEFEIGISDRYPTRDWIVFGPYYAPDARSLHSFHLPTNNSTFGKYLRIVVKSHHGNEHFCPLSLVKVYGKSEYEVLESETARVHDVESESPGIVEEEMNDGTVENSVFGIATQALINMVKNAADVLVSKRTNDTKPAEKIQSSVTLSSSRKASTCTSFWQCVPDSEYKPVILQKLSCHRTDLLWINDLLSWCGWDRCHDFLESNSLGSPRMSEGLLTAIYGPTIIPALCHFKHPLTICRNAPEKETVKLTRTLNEYETVNTTSVDELTQSLVPEKTLFGEEDLIEEVHSPGSEPSSVDPQIVDNNFQQSTPPPQVEEPVQKESVFVRLSNRIKALERNQSLSSGYLEELSQRFKRQSEELHSTHEIFRKSLNDSLSRCTLLESSLRYEVRKLNRNLDTLRDLIWRLELQRSGFFLLSLVQILSSMILWWNRKGKTMSTTVARRPSFLSELNLLNHRKRSCQSPSVAKPKKKKERKESRSNLSVKTHRIPSSLSTSSIPLGLPSSSSSSTPVLFGPSFAFRTPLANPPSLPSGSNGELPAPLPSLDTSRVTSADTSETMTPPVSRSGRLSSSDLSESSSVKSQKRKSKFKSFFLGK